MAINAVKKVSPLKKLRKHLQKYANKQKAKVLSSFFKTGPGEYGEGDIFLGVGAAFLRKIANQYKNLSLSDIAKLLHSPIHEERLLSLLILILQFNTANITEREKIYNFYLGNTQHINNWDLVDISAPHIIGAYLKDKDKKPLYTLAISKSIWERRVAIVSTLYFIRNYKFNDTLSIGKILLKDREDLIHKAVGWMLREVGKRNICILENFLHKYHKNMPRTILRYAIERFPESKRKAYLEGKL